MSVLWMAATFASDLKPTERLVLLAYVDHADDEGRRIFPSHSTIARKTGLGRRTVVAATIRLVDGGCLVATGTRKHGVVEYRVGPSLKAALAKRVQQMHTADKGVNLTPDGCVTDAQEGVQEEHTKHQENHQEESPEEQKIGRDLWFNEELLTVHDGLNAIALPYESTKFVEKWLEWCEYRRKDLRKPMTFRMANAQLLDLGKWGEPSAHLSIDNAMGAGWVRMYEPKMTPPKSPGRSSTQYKSDEVSS